MPFVEFIKVKLVFFLVVDVSLILRVFDCEMPLYVVVMVYVPFFSPMVRIAIPYSLVIRA